MVEILSALHRMLVTGFAFYEFHGLAVEVLVVQKFQLSSMLTLKYFAVMLWMMCICSCPHSHCLIEHLLASLPWNSAINSFVVCWLYFLEVSEFQEL